MSVKSVICITLQKNESGSSPYSVSATIERRNRLKRELPTLPFDWQPPDDLNSTLEAIKTAKAGREVTDQHLRELGKSLYDALFKEGTELWKALRDEQEEFTDDSVRLTLVIDSLELSKLPWEALFDDRFIAVRIPVVRALPDINVPNRGLITGTLNVLFIGASPAKLPGLNLEETAKKLKAALEQDTKRVGLFSRRMKMEVILNITEEKLRAELTRRQNYYHIICFAGHGDPDSLIFDDEYGESGTPMSAETFSRILGTESGAPRLVYLLACETGGVNETDTTNPLAGFARQLAAFSEESKIAAVIAMQTKVVYPTMETFTIDFSTASPISNRLMWQWQKPDALYSSVIKRRVTSLRLCCICKQRIVGCFGARFRRY